MLQREVRDIIRRVAEESQLPVQVVEAAFLSQFKCAKQTASEGEAGNPATFKNIKFPKLGTLKTSESKIYILQKYAERSKRRKDSE